MSLEDFKMKSLKDKIAESVIEVPKVEKPVKKSKKK